MKKLVALALVMVLALSLLVACSDSNTPSGTPSGNDNTPSSTPSGGDDKGGDNSGGAVDKGYPAYWNSDVPKLDGAVTFEFQIDTKSGSVTLNLKNRADEVDAYLELCKGKGYEVKSDLANPADPNNRNIVLKNGTYTVTIDYTDTNGGNVILSYSPGS